MFALRPAEYRYTYNIRAGPKLLYMYVQGIHCTCTSYVVHSTVHVPCTSTNTTALLCTLYKYKGIHILAAGNYLYE